MIEEAKQKKNISLKKIIIIILIILFAFFFYSRNIATVLIKVREYPIINKNIPANFNGLKIVQFSDIHYNSTTNLKTIKKIVKKINYLEPDVIIFTGDLIDSLSNLSKNDINDIAKELNKLNASINKYAIYGDDDYSDINAYNKIMNAADFKILDNQNELLFYNGIEPILLVGLASKYDLAKAYDLSVYNNIKFNYQITVLHEPDNITKIKKYNPNLVLAGHSLGGQIKLPIINGLFKFKGAKKYINNYYKVDNIDLYINNGIGTKKTKMRTFNNPSINLYRLYNQ